MSGAIYGGCHTCHLARILACALALATAQGAMAQEQGRALAHSYDGRWSVRLVCEETKDANGPVRGYEYAFDAAILEGGLNGRYESAQTAAYVIFTGTIGQDGTLEIRAVGNTGRPEYSVGRTAEGTPYAYTMRGRLQGNRGEAKRRELRRCTAYFSRI